MKHQLMKIIAAITNISNAIVMIKLNNEATHAQKYQRLQRSKGSMTRYKKKKNYKMHTTKRLSFLFPSMVVDVVVEW